jgi:hypothetical protein
MRTEVCGISRSSQGCSRADGVFSTIVTGRPLGLEFNARWRDFAAGGSTGGANGAYASNGYAGDGVAEAGYEGQADAGAWGGEEAGAKMDE